MDVKEILRQGVLRGIITQAQEASLLGLEPQTLNEEVKLEALGAEKKRGFNLTTVLCYLGALIIIFAFTYFLVAQWNELPTIGVLGIALGFQAVCMWLGIYLCRGNYPVSGGLLATAAVAITPLTIYSIEKLLGIWPVDPISTGTYNEASYHNFWMQIKPCWVYIELATIAVAALVLRWVPFAFLALVISHSAWFLSMDLAELILGAGNYTMEAFNFRRDFSIAAGAVLMIIGWLLNKRTKEDYSFWLFMYGALMFTVSSAMSWMDKLSLLFLAAHVVMMIVSIMWQRKVLLVFGAIGVYSYLAHLAYVVFRGSAIFPIVLAFLGLLIILGTVAFQRNEAKIRFAFAKQ